MIASRRVCLVGAIALAAATVACGSDGSNNSSNNSSNTPVTPGPTTSVNSCRTYPTKANVHTTTSASSIVFDAQETASFDSASRKATVMTNFANGAACSTSVVSYNSVAD